MSEEEDLTFETLLKLRNEVGLKTFKQFEAQKFYKRNANDVIQNQNQKHSSRNNDNQAPIEISSKKPIKNKNNHKRKFETRTLDPRFSDKCGKFNTEKMEKNYRFAFELREKELEEMKEKQRETKDKKKNADDAKRKYLIQRMENQKRERLNKRSGNKQVELLPNGSKFYKTKKVQRTEELVNKFLELKQAGKLEKHLDKRRKRVAGKERRKMNISK